MSAGVKALESPLGRMGVRTVDYVTLLKPELTGLSVLTALFGAFLAQTGGFELRPLLVVLAGTLMVGGGAGTLNQFIERREDSLMKRTERRPLPSARIQPAEALLFGSALSIAGVLLLAIAGTLFAGMVAFVTSTSYLFLYTPLKKYTPAATFIGGIPGALPPVIGWTAVRTDLGIEPVLLFLILFAWQMPHFYSLAWMYRKDYQRAGFSILTVSDTTGRNTARRMVLYSALLVALGPVTFAAGMTSVLSFSVTLFLGAGLLVLSWMFLRNTGSRESEERQKSMNAIARRIFFASLVYIPVLILAISADRV
ncbi:MAG TPA: heme o synthase [Bacteroidota bacterium]|nr:heme o synthase [Bacteroidota bacterium]